MKDLEKRIKNIEERNKRVETISPGKLVGLEKYV